MNTKHSTLCPDSLRAAPQIAALDVLVHAAETALIALCAAHPDLERNVDGQLPPLEQLADRVIAHATLAVHAVDTYRALLRDVDHLGRSSFDSDIDF